MQSRLIGAVLIEKGLITADQLEVALDVQSKTGERLGEIVVAQFGVSRLELASVLAEQWAELDAPKLAPPSQQASKLKVVEPLTPDEVHIRRPIGEIFVELGFISVEQLDAALKAQGESGARIGEILVEQGSLSRLDLASALAEQWSALQKLRPPAPVADPQPWQNGAPVVEKEVQGSPAPSSAELLGLEERLRLIERATATSLSQEDLEAAQLGLRAALGALEARIEAVAESAATEEMAESLGPLVARLDALESASVSTDVARLREELEELRAQPVTAEALADVHAAVERLEQRPERSDEVERLTGEIGALTARLDELADLGELRERLDATAGLAQSAEAGVHGLAHRLDALADLESRLDDVAARVPAEGALDDLHNALSSVRDEAATGERTDEIVALASRVEELADLCEVASSASANDLVPRIDELAVRLEEVAASVPASQTDALRARLESLEEKRREGDGALDRIASELAELGVRTHARLAELVDHSADTAALDEIRLRLDELARMVEHVSDRAPIDELRTRVDELAASGQERMDADALEALRAQVAAIAARGDSIGALEGRIGELENWIIEFPPAAELRDEMLRIAESGAGEHEALAEALALRSQLDGELAGLRLRIDELSLLPHEDSLVRDRVDAMAARFAAVEAAVEALADLESGVRAGIDRAVARGTDPLVERLDSAESRLGVVADLEGRVAALAAELELRPDGEVVAGELAGLRLRIDELSLLPHEDSLVRDRVDAMAARVESLGSLESSIAEVRDRVAEAEATRVADALGTGARLASIEASTGSHLQALSDFDERLSALAVDLERCPDGETLAGDIADLRARIETLATRTATDELDDRVSRLAERAETIVHETQSRISGPVDELNGRLDGIAHALGSQLDELTERVGGLVAPEELDAAAAKHVQWFQAELAALREAGDRRAALLEGAVADVDRARVADLEESRGAVDASVHAVRAELQERYDTLASQLQAQLAAHGALFAEHGALFAEHGARFDSLHAEHAEARAVTGRLESVLEQGLAALSTRITEEIAAARAASEQGTADVRSEAAALSSRIDEVLGMRYVDLQAARQVDERLAEQLDVLAELRENDAEAARLAASDISMRLDGLAGAAHAETAAVRAIAESLGAQVADAERQRLEDLAASELAGAELAARIDDLAVRSAESAVAVEHALRDELGALAARVEGHGVDEIEAREELRGELERLASSMGWRLERIEESLASDDSAVLRETVADIERRLEGQSALGEEQVKATERALRKGLAALGERLVESESAYVEAGNTLRRSIERLGAAVVEADARMADQIPVSPLEGCVAFAPTADGYRLIELPGAPPEIGATIELEVSETPLVVTRYGRSPLPLDGRPCAYLDRA